MKLFNNWVKPSSFEEKGELKRVSSEEDIDLDELIKSFENGKVVNLTNNDWQHLENTDSYNIENIEDVENLANEYGKDWKSILNAFKNNSKLPTPIILIRKDNTSTLIGGNTRLMIAKALKIQPKVLAVLEPKKKLKEIFNNWKKYNQKLFEAECKIPSIDIEPDRSTMPQIRPEMVPEFILSLQQQNIDAFKRRLPVAELKGSQSTVDCDKVRSLMAKGYEKLSQGTPIFISQDHIIADGHTRTQAIRMLDGNGDIACWEVQCDIAQLLTLMKRFIDNYDQSEVYSDQL